MPKEKVTTEDTTLPKKAAHISHRLFDLVRYSRSYLHQEELITDEEYAWLCAGAPLANSSKGGSPSRERLEEYDELRSRLNAYEKLTQSRQQFKEMIKRAWEEGDDTSPARMLLDSFSEEQAKVWAEFFAQPDFEVETDQPDDKWCTLLSYEGDDFASDGQVRVSLVSNGLMFKVVLTTDLGTMDMVQASLDQWGVWYRIGHALLGQEEETRSMLTGVIKCLEKLRDACEHENLQPDLRVDASVQSCGVQIARDATMTATLTD